MLPSAAAQRSQDMWYTAHLQASPIKRSNPRRKQPAGEVGGIISYPENTEPLNAAFNYGSLPLPQSFTLQQHVGESLIDV